MASLSTTDWSRLGAVPMGRLTKARLELHWAAQTVMAFADAALERLPDDSQSNLGWRGDLAALVSRPRPEGVAAGLSFAEPSLLMIDDDSAVVGRLPLAGLTIEGAVSWLENRLVAITGSTPGRPIRMRDYEMPDHAVATGEPFGTSDLESLKELAGWFGAGWSALEDLVDHDSGWAGVRCWPHHFDLGTLKVLGSASIGAGLSPGDHWYPEPYFYVNPYGLERPPADPPKLESNGRWHNEGWFGAVLPATTVLPYPTDSRAQAVRSFLHSAADAAAGLVSAAG
jgi:hypothetical protein